MATLSERHDEIVDAIADPDGLADEACKAGLFPPEFKQELLSLPYDTKTRTLSLVWSIRDKVECDPLFFHHFVGLLKKLPGLASLGITLQRTYGITKYNNYFLLVNSESTASTLTSTDRNRL